MPLPLEQLISNGKISRGDAAQFCHLELKKHGLVGWSVRLNQNAESRFLGLCSYKDQCIILSAHHIDIHPAVEVINTIRHEVAHALVGPGHGHDDVWSTKAREIGCDNTLPCSNLSLSPDIINEIRSGSDVEVTFEEQIIRTPKYHITRLQDKCETCGKVAREASSKLIVMPEGMPDIKIITLECGHVVTKSIPKGTPFHKFQYSGDPQCKHEWKKNLCVLCNRKRPYGFQLEGMAFAEAGLAVHRGVLIADEMGLGKTIQVGGVLFYHEELLPCLWFVKSAAKYQTSTFIQRWMGVKHIPQVINGSKDYLVPGLKHYICSYDLIVPKTRVLKNGTVVNQGFDINKFTDIGIKCVILDECQQIKNVDSTRTHMIRRVVKNLNCKVIGLSGTPWNNRGSELYPILNLLDPTKFNNEDHFKRVWVQRYWQGDILKEGGIANIKQFKEYTKDICIRRERKEVMPELPLVNRTKLNVVMNPAQELVYDEAVEAFVQWFEEQQGEISGMMIIAAMQKMRHLVAIAKIPATLEYVDEFIEDTDRKLCVFAHHTDAQLILFDELRQKYDNEELRKKGEAIPVLKLDGDMNAYDRNEVQEKFNRTPRCILVASQLAGGESINLQTCSDCVMHERQWNPGKEEQCEGRFIRIGSTATSVNAVYAHLDGMTTIDPKLDGIVERKRVQFHNWTETEATPWNEDAIMKELAQSIVNAHKQKMAQKKAS